MIRGRAVYIMTNQWHSTLDTSVTADLRRRNFQHQNKVNEKSFTARYNLSKLVYYEVFHNIEDDIAREKQIKAGSRLKKIALIEKMNPEWKDFSVEINSW